jgi:rubredoxin
LVTWLSGLRRIAVTLPGARHRVSTRIAIFDAMEIRLRCPECGNEDTDWAPALPDMRVCPKCVFAWRVTDEEPSNSR